MTEHVNVREARGGDGEAIAHAHVESWRAGYRRVVADEFLDAPIFAEGRREWWVRRLEHGPPATGDADDKILVPTIDEAVIGFGHVGREASPAEESPDAGEVYGFYLHPDHWGTGAADTLMDACLIELRSRFDRAVLWTLFDTPRSRRFYERNGWSCGVGDEMSTTTMDGPLMPGLPPFDPPLLNILYSIEL
jgi:GNAT superfamily N-acetyltransferase